MHAEKMSNKAIMHSDKLIVRAQEGDQNAQGQLVHLWYKRIYNFAYKFFHDHDLAMEVTQKTFIAMCRSLPGLQDVGRFKSWLYRIAINFCKEEVRKQKGKRAVPFEEVWNAGNEDSPLWESTRNLADDPDRQIQHKELSEILQGALATLSLEQREVVIMKEYEGLKFREIAEVLNISENTAKSRMYYGLEAMRKALIKMNITKDTVNYEI